MECDAGRRGSPPVTSTISLATAAMMLTVSDLGTFLSNQMFLDTLCGARELDARFRPSYTSTCACQVHTSTRRQDGRRKLRFQLEQKVQFCKLHGEYTNRKEVFTRKFLQSDDHMIALTPCSKLMEMQHMLMLKLIVKSCSSEVVLALSNALARFRRRNCTGSRSDDVYYTKLRTPTLLR